MKKLLLVLMVVALAAFLLVGCIPVTPGEGEGEGEGEVEICPTVAVSGQAVVGGKTYIKGGEEQTITVTFAVPTAPVSVYVGDILKITELDLLPGDEVVMHTTDNKVYTGTFTFGGTCDEGYIYVDTCDTCAYCKYPYTVDSVKPHAKIEVCIDGCTCGGCNISFTSTTTGVCTDTVNCGDACSGLASWAINIYATNPFDECCDASCETPIDYGSGTACPISWTTTEECFDSTDTVYVVVDLVDNVGNEIKYGQILTHFNEDTCDEVTLTQWTVVPTCLPDTTDWNLCDDNHLPS
jgi:hypothetical protein